MMRMIGRVRALPCRALRVWGPIALSGALILALLTCLLVLPATVSAKVDKKYAQAYAGRLQYIINQEKTQRDIYNAYDETLVSYATTLQELLASTDPTVQETIQEYKDLAKEQYEEMSSVDREREVYEKAVKRLYAQCKHMFSRRADRIRLKRWVDQWAVAAYAITRAFGRLQEGFYYLSQADVGSARTANQAAIALVQHAAPRIREAQQGLRALKR